MLFPLSSIHRRGYFGGGSSFIERVNIGTIIRQASNQNKIRLKLPTITKRHDKLFGPNFFHHESSFRQS